LLSNNKKLNKIAKKPVFISKLFKLKFNSKLYQACGGNIEVAASYSLEQSLVKCAGLKSLKDSLGCTLVRYPVT